MTRRRSSTSRRTETCRSLRGERVLHAFLQLLESTNFDLPDPLATYAVSLRELFQRCRLFLQAACFDDVALALAQFVQRAFQKLMTLAELFAFGHAGFLVERLVGDPVLPLGF